MKILSGAVQWHTQMSAHVSHQVQEPAPHQLGGGEEALPVVKQVYRYLSSLPLLSLCPINYNRGKKKKE